MSKMKDHYHDEIILRTENPDMYIYVGDSIPCPDCDGMMLWHAPEQKYLQTCCIKRETGGWC